MYPPHHYGGYELSCWDVMRRFAARGHTVSVLTTTLRVGGASDASDEGDTKVWRDLQMYWSDHALLSPSIPRRFQIEWRNRRRLRKALDDARPDVVSVWHMGALSLGLLTTIADARIPMVLNLGDDWLSYGPQLDAWSRLWLGHRRRPLARMITALTGVPTLLPDLGALGPCCFNSEATRRSAKEHTSWTFPRSGVVYAGIEESEFAISPEEAPIDARPWRARLLYVGRIDRRKGIHTAVEALAYLPGARLRILGRGDNSVLEELRATARHLGVIDRIEFGESRREQLPMEYRAADVCLFTSTWPEPFGLVPLEAMACDTPVVATGTGGSGEYLDDEGNCLLYSPGDERLLAGAVKRLADDPRLRTSLIRGGRATAAALTNDAFADVVEDWHRAAIEGDARGVPEDRHLPGRGHR